ncbi:MAG TPA: glycogen debranching enzyme, partial [Mycobacterium sp.]
MRLDQHLSAGSSSPLGAHAGDGGTNFSVWSRTATQVDLVLFDDVDDSAPACTITLDPGQNRTSCFWHVFVPGVGPGQVYTWRVH